MNVDIRPFRTDDRESVVALWKACGLVVPWNDRSITLGKRLEHDD